MPLDTDLRSARREKDPVREAILERRMGGGVEAWHRTTRPVSTDILVTEQIDDTFFITDTHDAMEKELELLRRCVYLVLSVARDDEKEGVSWWARSYPHFLYHAHVRNVVVVRLADIIVVSVDPPEFPDRLYEARTEWGTWVEISLSGESGNTLVCRTKASVKDRYARDHWERMVARVQRWAMVLENTLKQRAPHTLPRATSFTLAQARLFAGLDPAGA